ncbi:MAG: ABC transporter permease, partial [Chloroflexi bacterium]
MLKRVVTIAGLYLKTTYSSRSTFIFSIVMPLLFTYVLGQTIRGGGDVSTPERWALWVVDGDGSVWSERFVQELAEDGGVEVVLVDEERALTAVSEDEIAAALIIPAGFGAQIERGKQASLRLVQNPEQLPASQILQEMVLAARNRLAGQLTVADYSVHVAEVIGVLGRATGAERQVYWKEALALAAQKWADETAVSVSAQPVTRLKGNTAVPGGTSQSSPGMMVMYALFFTFGGGASLLVEREQGTLRRLLVTPAGKRTILAGKLVGIFTGALIQMSIMVLAGQFVFGVNWGQSPGALVLMLLAYGFMGTTLGLMVAALVRTTAQANAAGTIIVMALSSLGGAWWPIEIVPGWMQKLAMGLPTYWGMQGFHDIITRGLGETA